jgi:ABC-type dipeptide/oligopeptide/nickel transport system permease component
VPKASPNASSLSVTCCATHCCLGQLAFEALFSRDFNLLLGIFFLSACLVVAVNIVIDIIYVILDPRITLAK